MFLRQLWGLRHRQKHTNAHAHAHAHTLVSRDNGGASSFTFWLSPKKLHLASVPPPPDRTELLEQSLLRNQQLISWALGAGKCWTPVTGPQVRVASCPAHLGSPSSTLTITTEEGALTPSSTCAHQRVFLFFPLPLPGSSGHWLLLK